MATQRTFNRLLAMSLVLAALLPIAPNALAAEKDEMPFATSCEVADATLDTMRGGFDSPHGVKVPFGLEVKFDSIANGKHIASFDITNHGDKNQNVQVTENGFTVTQSGLTSSVSVGPNQTVTTNVTDKGIITVVQNAASSTTLQTMQHLTGSITGLNMKDFVRATGLNALHNSRVLFH